MKSKQLLRAIRNRSRSAAYVAFFCLALLVEAGCVSLNGADVHQNRIIAQTGISHQSALRAAKNSLRDAGFRVSRRAAERGFLRTEWTAMNGYDAQMQVWADVENSEVQLRGWYRKSGKGKMVVAMSAESDIGKAAWQVMDEVAQQLPGPVRYDYGFQ